MRLADLIADLPLRPVAGINPERRVCDLTEDSRTVVPGSLFIARPGTRADGRRYIAQAIDAGAVAVIVQAPACGVPASPVESYLSDITGVAIFETPDAAITGATLAERFYGSPSSRLDLVGITGTNGKSTIAHLIHRALNAAHRRTGLIGTVEIDDGVAIAPAEMTTPPASEISRTLAIMGEHGCTAAAMEVSSHALDQHRVDALTFRVGVFTNLTRDHLNYHQTMEAYAAAKARLFGMLSADATAVVNADDPAWAEMVRGTRARVVACTRRVDGTLPFSHPGADAAIHASVAVHHASIEGMELCLEGPWGRADLRTPLIGDHNAMNILQGVAAMWAIGVPASAWTGTLPHVPPPAGRLEGVSIAGDDIGVFVDYAHTPDALENVLRAVRAVAGSRAITVVFGAGGDKDRGKRPQMGDVASRLADWVVVTSDNPRSESPRSIIAEILDGIPAERRGAMQVHVDREHAIHAAINDASPGQIVLIAGKGHETEQVFADDQGRSVSRHFDDRQVARDALLARRTAGARA